MSEGDNLDSGSGKQSCMLFGSLGAWPQGKILDTMLQFQEIIHEFY